jgi:hypothetical protein
MKTTLLLLALTSSAFATPPVLSRPTAETLAGLRQATPMDRLAKPAVAKAPLARKGPESLFEQSLILNDGAHWTLLPQGAVLSLPESLKARLIAKPSGEFLTWTDFLTLNRGWITTHEVSIDQAAGNDPLSAERSAFLNKLNKVVVAVHRGGPISVLPPKETLASTQP